MDRKVTLRGTGDQIRIAKVFIEEIVHEEESFRSKVQTSVESRPPRCKQALFLASESHSDESSSDLSTKYTFEELAATSQDAIIEIYVSSITNPGQFFVQKVGPRSIALDKLVQDMSAFYDQDHNRDSFVLKKVETDFYKIHGK